jgi:hypothetical protein
VRVRRVREGSGAVGWVGAVVGVWVCVYVLLTIASRTVSAPSVDDGTRLARGLRRRLVLAHDSDICAHAPRTRQAVSTSVYVVLRVQLGDGGGGGAGREGARACVCVGCGRAVARLGGWVLLWVCGYACMCC